METGLHQSHHITWLHNDSAAKGGLNFQLSFKVSSESVDLIRPFEPVEPFPFPLRGFCFHTYTDILCMDSWRCGIIPPSPHTTPSLPLFAFLVFPPTPRPMKGRVSSLFCHTGAVTKNMSCSTSDPNCGTEPPKPCSAQVSLGVKVSEKVLLANSQESCPLSERGGEGRQEAAVVMN